MNLAKLDHNELLQRCAWCHQRIPTNHECFGTGGKLTPEAKVLLAGKEGQLVPLRLQSGKAVIVMVPGAASEARAAGHDVFFQTCSDHCGKELSETLRNELSAKS